MAKNDVLIEVWLGVKSRAQHLLSGSNKAIPVVDIPMELALQSEREQES